jgi:regulator of sigma E protease
VQTGSPAAAAGLAAGDSILAVDGRRYDFYSTESVVTDLRANAGETVTLTVERADGRVEDLSATLRPPEEVSETRGPLGISVEGERLTGEYTGRDLPSAIGLAATDTGRWFGLILAGLGDLVGSIASDPGAAPPVSGPIGIAQGLGDIFWNSGPILTLYLAGILSANLALVNALPFPPLDGGRILMIVLKRIFGARISVRAERLTYFVGFIFLFTFLIWITGFDILRGLGGVPTP